MASFRIVEHKVPGQHVREYANATANSQEEVLHISAKQYIPLDNQNPSPGDVTIIGAHANGFPKELYEALWEDILQQSRQQGWRIRSIWIADAAFQGRSGELNAKSLGNDPGWFDHARDLLQLINAKRDEMRRPLVGVGHSMGGVQLAYLSLMHPRLLTSLILLDPIIMKPHGDFEGHPMAALSTFRRTTWPSLKAAQTSFEKSGFYRRWDRRVFQAWMEHGLTEVPASDTSSDERPVTLTTPVAQEAFGYYRRNYEGHGTRGRPMNRITHPDIDETLGGEYPFYRPEITFAYRHLPELRPSVLWIFPKQGGWGEVESYPGLVSRTGIGTGGSGGEKEGRVKGLYFDKVGHLMCFDDPARTAQAAAAWIGEQAARFRDEETAWRRDWQSKPLQEKQEIEDKWKELVGGPPKKAKM